MSDKIKLNIAGMSCVNCSNSIQKVTSKIAGVKSVNVSFANSIAEYEVENKDVEAVIISKIQKLGFEVVKDYKEVERLKLKNVQNLKRKFIVGAVLCVFIMVAQMLFKGSFSLGVAFALTSVVIFYCAKDFFINAFKALRFKNFDMNVLVALGSGSAYIYSAYVFLKSFTTDTALDPNSITLHAYFDSAAMIVTFILLGKFLEERSKLKANDYIKSLLDLTPKKALLLLHDSTTKEILADDIKLGDVVLVKSGMHIPCDGVVIGGGAEVDLSILTGESMAAYKKAGDQVYSGTTNTNGFLNVKCNALKHNSLLSRITQLLSEAGSKKMPISRVADRVANIFVPSVVLIALATFFIWWFAFDNAYNGFICAISVLIISCPCALGLATPIAIVCALSNSAKNGLLIKNAEIFEILKDVKIVLFDKTGTLTKGKISVYKTNLNKSELSKVASLESLSEHLISKAIVSYAKDNDIKVKKIDNSDFKNVVGKGISGSGILVGSREFLEQNGIKFTPLDEVENFLKQGFGAVFVAIDGEFCGYIVLSDELRASAKEAISSLKQKNIKTIMLTGDNAANANYIADKLNLDRVYSQVLPQDKLRIVKEFQQNSKVIFVGDGVNDAPSLKQADCSVAMNSGSDIAKQAGDALLVNNNLALLDYLYTLSQKTMQVIKQNLFWAFFYNAICIPIAAGVFYAFTKTLLNPSFAALAMCFSSISVVLNSLRLKFFDYKKQDL